MSEYNADIRNDECGNESIHGDEQDDILDDLNNLNDSEVIDLMKKKEEIYIYIFIFSYHV